MKIRLSCGLVVLGVLMVVQKTETNKFPTASFWSIAKSFGQDMNNDFKAATKLLQFKGELLKTAGLEIKEFNGQQEVLAIANRMKTMLEQKVVAIEKLVKVAEDAYKKYNANEDRPMDRETLDKNVKYFNAKKLLDKPDDKIPNADEFGTGYRYMDLSPLPHFNFVAVNTSVSTVHVPTNVFDRSKDVLVGVSWTQALDEVFVKNYEDDPTLTWQYFGGAKGYFRLYPGTKWQSKDANGDFYDARTSDWYIQAASSPKAIVIMIDISGSMEGLRLKIALETAKRILDTLSDDDFFNVVLFNDRVNFLDDCFNDTLIQANGDNKKRIKQLLADKVSAEEMADWPQALESIFKLFDTAKAHLPNQAEICNKALMIITDGPPDHYVEVFKKYNRPVVQVRVFTYLIGQEASNTREARWMACSNKGYFTKIATMADIEENIQIYIHVLSRPLVLSDIHENIWTSVYFDAAYYVDTLARPLALDLRHVQIMSKISTSDISQHGVIKEKYKKEVKGFNEHSRDKGMAAYQSHPDKGLRMMTSVAQPVFDPDSAEASHTQKKEGRLLGVMGIDVPIKQITKLAPEYLLGVNGYSFAITNNGYILFHPDFRPTQDGKEKPNYNSVDLVEVELEKGYTNEHGYPNYDMTLRTKLIQAISNEAGVLEMATYVHYDNMTRVAERKHKYYYTLIQGTPFSLGIAYPNEYGDRYRITATYSRSAFTSDQQADIFPNSVDYRIKVSHDWEGYCNLNYNDTLLDPITVLVKYLLNVNLFNNCSEDVGRILVKSILYDAVATKNAKKLWDDGKKNSLDNGVMMVFMGTRAGVTRYYTLDSDKYEKDKDNNVVWFKEHDKTITELYYKRAIDNAYAAKRDKDVVTWMIPEKRKDVNGNSTLVIMGVSPLFVKNSGQSLPFAVFGMEMTMEMFVKKFTEKNSICEKNGNPVTCEVNCLTEDGFDCYLLDENGFVIFSKKPEQIGKFFGEVDSLLLGELVNKEVYKRIEMYDYQAVCNIYAPKYSSAVSFVTNPIQRLMKSVSWFFSEIIFMLLQLNLLTWWNSSGTMAQGQYTNVESGYGQPSEGQFKTGEKHCLISTGLYDMRPGKLGVNDDNVVTQVNGYFENATFSTARKSTWSANRVVKSNLIFLVVDGVCADCGAPPISIEPTEVTVTNATVECAELRRKIIRRVPKECHDKHELEDSENHCSKEGAMSLRVSAALLVISTLLATVFV